MNEKTEQKQYEAKPEAQSVEQINAVSVCKQNIMTFSSSKTIQSKIEIKEAKPYGMQDSCHKYLAIINGELIQIEYEHHENETTGEEIEYFIDTHGNYYERSEITKIYSVYCR